MDQQQSISNFIESNLPQYQQTSIQLEFFIFSIKVLLMIALFVLIIKRKKRDLKKTQIKQSSNVPISKIIVALEIQDFLFHLKNRFKPGFQLLQIPNHSPTILQKLLSYTLGWNLYYKSFFPNRQVINFVKTLKNIQKVELMIYTILDQKITDQLLKRLKLSQYFPVQNRKFYDPRHADMMKHAIDVDKQSRRVIIVTPCKKDHSSQDEKYFLVMNPKGGRNKQFLKELCRIIKEFIDNNKSLDTLHDELFQVKINVEDSDVSDISDIEKQLN